MYACRPGDNCRFRPRRATPLQHATFHFLTLLAFVACGKDVVVTQPPGTIHLSLVSGDNQVAEVGASLQQQLVVHVSDNTGVPVEGVDVTFVSANRDGVVLSVRSDARGSAAVPWTLGERAGEQVITATAPQPIAPSTVRFRARALAGPTTQIAVSPTTDFLAMAGTQLDTLTAILTDRFGNLTTFVDVSWSIQTGGGTVRPFRGNSDERGLLRAAWTLGNASGKQSLVVSAGTATRTVFATIVEPLGARQVAAGGSHTCALSGDGTAYCWGSNWWGQLGIGLTDVQPHRVPASVREGPIFKFLTAGASHTCGLALDGFAWCWGFNQAWPPSEEWGGSHTGFPVQVPGAPKFTSIAAGEVHTCGLTTAGLAYCWGDNSLGQLGRGTDRTAVQPYQGVLQQIAAPVAGSLVFSSIAAAANVSCAVTTTGESYCWGENNGRILGSDTQQNCRVSSSDGWDYGTREFDLPCSTSPVRVSTSSGVNVLTMDANTVCAVLTTSQLECWGRNVPPSRVPGAHVSTAWALSDNVCGLQADDSVKCWRMQMPFAESTPFGTQQALVDLRSSRSHHCGLSRHQAPVVYCWGENWVGALGDGTTLHRPFPVPVVSPRVTATASRVP